MSILPSQAADARQFAGGKVLLQDGHQIGFGHIIGKGTVPEDEGGGNRRGYFLPPSENALGQRF